MHRLREFLNTYKKTAALARSISASAMPAKVRANVRAFLRKKIRRLAAIFLYFSKLCDRITALSTVADSSRSRPDIRFSRSRRQ